MDVKTKSFVTKIFNDLVAIPKNKVTLRLNKLAYVGMWIFDFCKLLMFEFYNDYIKKINMVTNQDQNRD